MVDDLVDKTWACCKRRSSLGGFERRTFLRQHDVVERAEALCGLPVQGLQDQRAGVVDDARAGRATVGVTAVVADEAIAVFAEGTDAFSEGAVPFRREEGDVLALVMTADSSGKSGS